MKVRGHAANKYLKVAIATPILVSQAIEPAAAQTGDEQLEEIVVTGKQFRDDATSDVTGSTCPC